MRRGIHDEPLNGERERRLTNPQPRRPLARPFKPDPLERGSRRHEPCTPPSARAPQPQAKRTFISDVKVQSLERRRRPSRPLSRRSSRREHAKESDADLPDDSFALLERDGDEASSVGRPRESGDRSLVPFEDVEACSRLEVVDDRCAFMCAHCQSLGLAVEVDGRVAAR